MKKSISFIIWGMLLLVILYSSEVVQATSWAELEPEEVHKRADVIVVGQYDFTSKPEGRNMVFTSYKFNVQKVYKGDVSQEIRAGIDGYDVGWADEYQKDGGDFLLFLDKNKEISYLTPVGGPNGMIQISNGGLQHYNSKSRAYYEEFLKKQSEDPIVKTSNESVPNSKNKYLYISFIVIFIGLGIFTLYQKLKKINKE
ncbi:hypothetical protein [Fictibacillus norfolkensis]|uniref:Uncharacterized protein n=1 Tax=Fictibacillus norfolkensis TaxID=2762233 RepID=A0ABR8SJD0_9BACL|nr:hypothetical protein [Fictibacillus norfolkensis]MBD7963594.1 hypothetical protein [Fictibacillus norfolkensis]